MPGIFWGGVSSKSLRKCTSKGTSRSDLGQNTLQKKHTGSYSDSHRHGYGKLTWPDGCTFEGTWQHGARRGKGTFTDETGESLQQLWNERSGIQYSITYPQKHPDESSEEINH